MKCVFTIRVYENNQVFVIPDGKPSDFWEATRYSLALSSVGKKIELVKRPKISGSSVAAPVKVKK